MSPIHYIFHSIQKKIQFNVVRMLNQMHNKIKTCFILKKLYVKNKIIYLQVVINITRFIRVKFNMIIVKLHLKTKKFIYNKPLNET